MEIEIKNAIIESAIIDIGDRGLLTAWVFVDYGGSGQGFGGYALYLPSSFANHKNPGNYAGHFIYKVLEIAGCAKWNELKGRTIRVKCEHNKIHAIGHIVKDLWFNPSEDFERIEEGVKNNLVS